MIKEANLSCQLFCSKNALHIKKCHTFQHIQRFCCCILTVCYWFLFSFCLPAFDCSHAVSVEIVFVFNCVCTGRRSVYLPTAAAVLLVIIGFTAKISLRSLCTTKKKTKKYNSKYCSNNNMCKHYHLDVNTKAWILSETCMSGKLD